VLVNVYDWMVSDLSGVGDRLRSALAPTPGMGTPPPVAFEKGRSRLESVKAFPENLNVRAKLTYRPSQPASLASVPDGRYVPVTVAYVFAELPKTPMEPRAADDRVGYFMTVRKDFSREDERFFVRQINRWRLEPGERVGSLVKPKQPITYYLDPNIPEAYRPYMKAGVEAWNAAFEAAGWKDAVRAEMLPEGADAEDLRYATLRWNTSDQPGYGAIGPSIVDPRTGEILDADILFEASMVNGFRREWKTTVSPAAALEELFAEPTQSGEWASLAGELSAQGSLLRAMLAASEEIGPGEVVPMSYVGEALKWVTMHEVGHTLGLRHNFRSSADTPLEKLHDREWTGRNGVFSSVMEYPALNLAGRKKPGGYVYNPGVGSYDRWAVTYGYTPDAAQAARVAREAAKPGHAYGTDEDAVGPGALDPTVNPFDLGADPLAWGKERAELVRGMWNDLPRHVLSDNTRYADLTDAFGTLMTHYVRALGTGVKYIGGQYQYRDRVGDPDARAPFVPVPVAKQQEALAFLTEYGFSERAFQVPPRLLAQLGANRWSHWGEQNSFGGRIDYPFTEHVLAVQRSLLRQVTSPFVFGRIRDAELKFGSRNTLPVTELMAGLTRSIWSEVYAGERSIPTLRRELQRAYLDQLTELVATPPARLPGDARAVARMQLTELNRRIGQRLSGGADDYTRAHLAESRARIERALEAGLDVE
ncbi:MAG: zinc-dependent metalloprotease, partial [Gemmatimonadota bacterium]|nr:zinc-dependent metalloprotease [Gemmatimonadota bacterium]